MSTLRTRAARRALAVAVLAVLAVPASASAGIVFPDGDIEREGVGDTGANVTWTDPRVEISDGSVTGGPNCDPDSGDHFATGTTEVTCLAAVKICPAGPPAGVCTIGLLRDSFTVTVTRGVGPVLSGLIDRAATAPAGQDGVAVSYPLPAASDPSGIEPGSLACAPAPGSRFPVGSTTVTCNVRDTAGNGSSGSFAVDVAREAPRPPVATEPSLPGAPGIPAAPGATPQAPGAPADAPGAARPVSVRRLRVSPRLARVVLVCPSGNAAACIGTLRVEKPRARGRRRLLGRRAFTLQPGQRKTLRVRLGRAARRAIGGRKRVRLRVVATTSDQAGQALTGVRTFRVRSQRR